MNEQLSVLRLIVQASVPVQIVIGILLLASLDSWAIIFRKRRVIARVRREADRFESRFWSGDDLAQLYRTIESHGGATGMAGIFEFGFREFARLRQQSGIDMEQLLEGSRRAMRVAQLKEVDRLEQSLATLATVGSTSPYVGLFGTVWGIMSAFSSLGNIQQVTLAQVAPGISEALVATAFGLFAAIPAVVAYNRFADQVTRIEIRFDAFIEEFSTILQRHAARAAPARQRLRAARRRYAAADGGHMAQTTRGRRLMGEINVVPYIDVMLVLLIIFLITAPLLTQGVKVDLPKAGAEPLDAELLKNSMPLVLSIDRQGRLYMNIGGGDPHAALDPQTVALRATAALRRDPELPVLVKADTAVAYGRVVQAMVLLQHAGARKVGFITEPPPRSEGRGG